MSRSSYRDLPGLNYSAIKTFKKEGLDVFYKEYILKIPSKKQEELEEKEGVIFGSLFDFLRIDCQGDFNVFINKLDEKFSLFDGVRIKSQLFLLADELFKLTKRDLKEDGTFSSSFESRFREALNNLKNQDKFKGKTFEAVLEAFQAEPSSEEKEKNPYITSAETYFNAKLSQIGKKVIDLYQLDIVKRLNEQSIEDEWVRDIFNSKLESKPKFVVEFDIEGISEGGKVEIDLTLWDHKNKIVYPFDVKTIYSNKKSDIKYRYKKMLYGWQAAYYTLALENYLKKNKLDYTIAPFEFIFFSTKLKYRPVKLKMTDKMMEEALNGFSYEGIYYSGLLETIEELKYHIKNDIWDTEKEQTENNGYITI